MLPMKRTNLIKISKCQVMNCVNLRCNEIYTAKVDDNISDLLVPVSIIIIHAYGKSSFVSNALLIYKSGVKKSDFHKEMNTKNYVMLIPDLPSRSVLVIGNASYHNIHC